MRLARSAVLLASLVACGGDDVVDPPIDAPVADAPAVDGPVVVPDAMSVDTPTAMLTLTSTAITEGGVIAARYSCQGDNVSPPLAWSGAAGASYAVVLTDLTNPLIHSIIYDIPGAVMALPENVPNQAQPTTVPGAVQPFGYDGRTRGYLGPCPGSTHTYQFAVFALDVATLPGLTAASTRVQVKAAILEHDTATATLTATFTP